MHESETRVDNQNPVKLAVAIGLCVIFLIVVVVQIINYWPDTNPTGAADLQDSETEDLEVLRLNRLADSRTPRVGWPKVELSECIRYDPFSTPGGFSSQRPKAAPTDADRKALEREIELAAKRAAQDELIASMRDVGVNAVFRGAEKSSAIVGSEMVRVGENLNGFRVLAIEPDGIVIERPAVD